MPSRAQHLEAGQLEADRVGSRREVGHPIAALFARDGRFLSTD